MHHRLDGWAALQPSILLPTAAIDAQAARPTPEPVPGRSARAFIDASVCVLAFVIRACTTRPQIIETPSYAAIAKKLLVLLFNKLRQFSSIYDSLVIRSTVSCRVPRYRAL